MRDNEIHKLDHELSRLQARPGYVLQQRRLRHLLQVLSSKATWSASHWFQTSHSQWSAKLVVLLPIGFRPATVGWSAGLIIIMACDTCPV